MTLTEHPPAAVRVGLPSLPDSPTTFLPRRDDSYQQRRDAEDYHKQPNRDRLNPRLSSDMLVMFAFVVGAELLQTDDTTLMSLMRRS